MEGGGKRRIFAIGNYVNQRLLKPFHSWLMTVLSRIRMYAIFNKYPMTWKQVLRVSGAGYKTMARMQNPRNRFHERLFRMYLKPGLSSTLPLDWWLGRGCPLNPYLRGFVIDYLRSVMKPRDLVVPSLEMPGRENVNRMVRSSFMDEGLVGLERKGECHCRIKEGQRQVGQPNPNSSNLRLSHSVSLGKMKNRPSKQIL